MMQAQWTAGSVGEPANNPPLQSAEAGQRVRITIAVLVLGGRRSSAWIGPAHWGGGHPTWTTDTLIDPVTQIRVPRSVISGIPDFCR
jgi:hypothetical protein